ncbi:MAG TPA: hypothetical protein VKZ66_01425 [Pusillimonas sp.]|nr:hypothetical protein [Pusillimonas sp.]HLU18593.1 hypothetical protein [Pusillimonas sp.]
MRVIISLVYFDYLLRTPRDHQDGLRHDRRFDPDARSRRVIDHKSVL